MSQLVFVPGAHESANFFSRDTLRHIVASVDGGDLVEEGEWRENQFWGRKRGETYVNDKVERVSML